MTETMSRMTHYLAEGVKFTLCLWAVLFVLDMFFASPEIYRDNRDGASPESTSNSRVMNSKNLFSSTEPPVGQRDDCHNKLPLSRSGCSKLPNYFLYKEKRKFFQDAIINFWHLQKTGGSTLAMCLTAMYENLNLPPPIVSMASCVDLSRILNDVTRVSNMTYKPVIYGHYGLGVCDFLRQEITNRKCSVFTLFRDPFERAVSYYFFHREYADQDPNLRDTLELPVNKWVKKYGSVVWNSFMYPEWTVVEEENGQKTCTDFFNDTLKTPWPQNEYLMNDIINNLDKELSFIGLFEDQPTTYRMLEEIYNLPFYDVCLNIHEKEGSYEGLNATSRRELKRQAKEILMKDKELQELMKFDIRIYEKAKEIFYAQKYEFERMKN